MIPPSINALLDQFTRLLSFGSTWEHIFEYEILRHEVSTFEFACYRVHRALGASPDEEKDAKWERYLELLHHRALVADFPGTARIVKFRRYVS